MFSVGDLVWYKTAVAEKELGVGIVTQTSTTADAARGLPIRRAIYRVHWQKSPVRHTQTGWLFAHQLVSATKEKQLPKQ